FEDLQKQDGSWRLFDPDLVRAIGMLPMEYLYFCDSRARAVENSRAAGGSRGEQVQALNADLWPRMRAAVDAGDLGAAESAWERAMNARDETYFARERGEDVADEPPQDEGEPIAMFEGEGYEGLATAVITASALRMKVPLILNVPNRGAIPDLADDDVVEVTCLTDENGAHPLAQGRMP